MEEIGPVLVGVNYPLVFVTMRVASRHGQTGMAMVVVAVIMAVDMFVGESLMHMDMNVALQQQKRYRSDEESHRRHMDDGKRLAEDSGREGNPDERRAGEDNLGTRGTQPLRGGDVQHDAGAIGTRTDQQSSKENR